MKTLGLKARLILVISFLTLLVVGVCYLGYKGLRDGETALQSIYADQVMPLTQLKKVYTSHAVVIVDTAHKLAEGATTWEEGRRTIGDARVRADGEWKAYLQTNHGVEESRMVAEALPLARAVDAAMDQLAEIMRKEDRERLKAFNATELYRAYDPFTTKLDELSDVQVKEVVMRIAESEHADRTATATLLTGGLVAIVLAAILGFNLVRLAGDLAVLVASVQKSGLQVNTSVTEVAATAKEQQATASEIAATTTEIGATSKEITATSKELVRTMEEVSSVAEQSAALAGSGQAGLTRMEETVGSSRVDLQACKLEYSIVSPK